MVSELIARIEKIQLSPLDLLPQADFREKIVNLVIQGVPGTVPEKERGLLEQLRQSILEEKVEHTKVVVFGGGTGLSNIIGGDSRQSAWVERPFGGLKARFPGTRSIVCVTDNGGSTGEILKDLPLIGVGDMRHVLVSSLQSERLQQFYRVVDTDARNIVREIHHLFNYRFDPIISAESKEIISLRKRLLVLPDSLSVYLAGLFETLFGDERLAPLLRRKNCLGNLLMVASFYQHVPVTAEADAVECNLQVLYPAIENGLVEMCMRFGCAERAVMPCTPTPAQLRVRYANGIEIIGEHKLEKSRRGYPVETVEVEYCGDAYVYDEVIKDIEAADILIMAPGSLYSSIIPVFKVPGIVEAVRGNLRALKILIGNLWVQAGETDLSLVDPERKFHLSDMIQAYDKNIPGGINGLVDEVVCIALKDIPGSVLQNYAVEGKSPIYLDRDEFSDNEFTPIECDVYSRAALAVRAVIQHDPDKLALAVKTLYSLRKKDSKDNGRRLAKTTTVQPPVFSGAGLPCRRFHAIGARIEALPLTIPETMTAGDGEWIRETICEILWEHPVVPLSHLDFVSGVCCIDPQKWDRDQRWDNVFSFYDPDSGKIRIRADQVLDRNRLETGFMIAVGEALLGNYALTKTMEDVAIDGLDLGRVYRLTLRSASERSCYFSADELATFLELSRMVQHDDQQYTRLLNHGEGFTPPGLLMGLMYAWYVDNSLASHIEYKMSIMKINRTDLIPEQLKMSERRKLMIEFFTEVVFRSSRKNTL